LAVPTDKTMLLAWFLGHEWWVGRDSNSRPTD
jgi:hypothetical protein